MITMGVADDEDTFIDLIIDLRVQYMIQFSMTKPFPAR